MGKKKKHVVEFFEDDAVAADDMFNDPEALSRYLSGFKINDGPTQSKPHQLDDDEIDQLAEAVYSSVMGNGSIPKEMVTGRVPDRVSPKPIIPQRDKKQRSQFNIARVTMLTPEHGYLNLTDRVGNANTIELDFSDAPDCTFDMERSPDTTLFDLWLAQRICSVPDAVFLKRDLDEVLYRLKVKDFSGNDVHFLTLGGPEDDVILCYYCPESEFTRFANYLKSKIPAEYLPDVIIRSFVRIITTPFVEKLFLDTGNGGNFAESFYTSDTAQQDEFISRISGHVATIALEDDEFPDISRESVNNMIEAIFSELGEHIVDYAESPEESEENAVPAPPAVNVPQQATFQPYDMAAKNEVEQRGTGVQNDNIPFLDKDHAASNGGFHDNDSGIGESPEDKCGGSEGTPEHIREGEPVEKAEETTKGISDRGGSREFGEEEKVQVQTPIRPTYNGSGGTVEVPEDLSFQEEIEEGKEENNGMVIDVVTIGSK